jgi:hypothetical protein
MTSAIICYIKSSLMEYLAMRFPSIFRPFATRKPSAWLRRRYFIENMILERRDVPALPTNLEQELLEWVNRFRMDPGGEYDRYISSTSPVKSPIPGVAEAVTGFGVTLSVLKTELAALPTVPPLAWNTYLNDAALGHNQKMIARDSQAHVLPGESDIGTRIAAAGYSNWSTYGENVYAYARSPAYAQAGFVIDWGGGTNGMQSPRGHRNNLIYTGFKELGISITPENNPTTQVGPLVVTQDFGDNFNRTKPSVLGVIFTDTTSNYFYDAGEGNGGISVSLTGTGGTFTTTSWASGGYQFDGVPTGSYTLSIAGPGINTEFWTRSITVSANNVKSDFDLSQQPKSLVGFDTATEVQILESNSVVITLTRQGTISDSLDVTITTKDIAGSSEIWQNLILPIANNGLVHFNPNQATATFTVQTQADNIIRPDTHLNLELTVLSNKYVSPINLKPLFILNDDGSVGFDSAAEVTLKEGSSSTLNIRRIGPVTEPFDVTVTPQDNTGSTEIWENLIQPLANHGVVHFDPGQSVATITIQAISDNIVRTDTPLKLKLVSSSANFAASVNTRSIFVVNNDQTVGFDNLAEAEVKAGGQVTININRSGSTTEPLDVLVTPVDIPGSIEIWQDLLQALPGGGLVHFNAGQTKASLTISAIQDGVLRANTHLNLQLSSTAPNTNIISNTKPLLVSHVIGSIGFESGNEILIKEGGLAVLNITRTGPTDVASDVDIQFIDIPGSTETWQNLVMPLSLNGRIHFNANDTTASIVIQAIQDRIIRADTKINLKLTSPSSIFNTALDTVPVIITNDDGTVSFETSIREPVREGGQISLKLVRSDALTYPLDVKISPVNIGSGLTWQNLIQPITNSGIVHFNPGQSIATFTIQALQDNVIKPDTQVTLQLGSNSPSVLVSSNQKTIFVQNDEGSVNFETHSELQLIEGGQATLKIVRVGAVIDPLDISIKPINLTNSTEVWQNLIQALPNNGTLHFDTGQTEAFFTLQALQDGIVRPDTRLNLQLQSGSANWSSTTSIKPVFILNEDTSVSFESGSEIQLNEGSQQVINLVRSGSLTSPMDVIVRPTDITGSTISWQNLIQPLPNQGVIHFEPNQAIAGFTLQAIQDDLVLPNTRLNLVLSIDSPGVAIAIGTRPVDVINNDMEKPGTFQFAATSTNSQVSEAAGKAILTITRTGGSLGQVVLPWTITQTAGPKISTMKPVDITFAAGVISKSIEIRLGNDKLAQPDQVFSIQLGQPKTASALLGTSKTAILKVLDDDPKPTISSLKGQRTNQQLNSLDTVFSAPLNASTARLTNLWTITEAGVDGLFGTRDDIAVRLKSAAYKSASKTITLRFSIASKSSKPLNYQVSLNGNGIQNSYGAYLNGTIIKTIKI